MEVGEEIGFGVGALNSGFSVRIGGCISDVKTKLIVGEPGTGGGGLGYHWGGGGGQARKRMSSPEKI